jgi:N-acetylneuraminic acid mutarotase
VLTLTASAIAGLGTSTVVITGTSAGVATVITTFGLTVAPPPGFILAAIPSNLAIAQGTSGAGIINISGLAGFTGAVTLAASGLPSGVTASFGTNPTTGNSVLTLTASATALLGTAAVTITGTSAGAAPETATLTLTIAAFALSDSPNGLMVTQGASGASTVTVTGAGGFTGSVTLAASGLPNGVTASFGANPTTGSSVLTLTASATAALGIVTVTITGSSPGVPSATSTLALMVTAGVSATNEWTWMGGSSNSPAYSKVLGLYGTLGVPAAGNVPGGRYLGNGWTDGGGNLWLFGGIGFAAAGTSGFLNDLWEFNPATNEWAWMGGGSTLPTLPVGSAGNSGVYGALGVAAAGNTPGGRFGASNWTDSGGHLWLFGGGGYDAIGNFDLLNDLWEFNPAANQWTWMGGGSTGPANNGNPGVYGTLGVPAAGNIPGGREYASSWTDSSGHFWLFGGAGIDAAGNASYLNDLWEFNLATNQWAWMGGGSTVPVGQFGDPGVYGTLGVPAAANIPGSRMSASTWTDNIGNLWFFGGDGWDANGNRGYLNDLWKFSPSTNQWTWMGGGSTVPVTGFSDGGNPGVYGAPGVPASGNVPGGRHQASGWTDSSGYRWLFGGEGRDVNGNRGHLNDLWVFDPTTNEWAWMGGASVVPSYSGNPGAYGTLGVPGAGNIPGSRHGISTWTDGIGRLWLFGGSGFDANDESNFLNDLWMYQPHAPGIPGFSLSANPGSLTIVQGAAGTSTVTVTDSGGFTGSVTLAASGLPSGVTASFSPNPATATSVITLTASSSAAPGNYSPAITGTSGTLTAISSLPLTIVVSTVTTLSSSANPSNFGQSVTFTAMVSPSTATGTVQFFDGATSLGTATVASGSASLTLSSLAAGPHSITAVYSGDINDATSTSTALTQTVSKAAPSVTLVSSANPSSYGESVTFTATLSPSSATGTVQFLDGSTALGTATITSGSASLAVSVPAVGTHSITAVYSGDANVAASTSATLVQTVGKAVSSVTLISSVNPSTAWQAVIFRALVSPASATGTVQFLLDGTLLVTAPLSGASATANIGVNPGVHTVTAVYGGDDNDAPSTSAAIVQTVSKVTSSIALTSSANPSLAGQSVALTATLSPLSASGTVQFLDGTTLLGTAPIPSGSATLVVSNLAAGAHSITAVYGGDANDTNSTSAALVQTVNKAPSSVALASSANPSSGGQSITLTATVSPASSTGTIQFLDGSTALGTVTISGGSAAFSLSSLSAGSHSITAVYGGDANDSASTSAVLTQTVNKAVSRVTVASSLNPSTFARPVTLSATVTPGTATGAVQFLDGSTTLGTATISGGAAAFSLSSLSVGAHSITAVYSGDGNDAASTSAVLTQTVNKGASSVTVTSSMNPSLYGQSVTLSAAITPSSATGTVQFLNGSAALGTVTISGGSAAFSLSSLSVGAHSIAAVYSGDTSEAASTSAVLTQTVNKATSTVALASSKNPAASGQSVTFTATVSPNSATGTAQFLDGSTALGTVTIKGGSAALSIPNLSVGTHSVKAVYSGDSNYLTSTSAVLTQSVTGAACHVTYAVTTQWNGGFGTAITIENTGTTSVNGWNLTWTWPGNQKITGSWDATYSQSGTNAKLTNESYDAAIAPGATLTGVGFNASYSGTNSAPTAFSLNGTLCK